MNNLNKIFLTLLALIYSFASSAQCAMCSATVDSNDENLVGQGLNAGIIFLMISPYILVGTVAYIWYKKYKKSHQE